MNLDREPMEASDRFALPADLTDWVSAPLLMLWVKEEVEKLDWTRPEVVAYLKRHPEYQPQALLGLLAYAYATQVLGSEDIVGRCYSDRTFQSFCQGAAPIARELMRFRRENRGLLRGILYELFARAIQARFPAGHLLLPPGLKRLLLDTATERLDVARHMDSLEE